MDNHETHISFEVIRLAKNSGVILLTLPPLATSCSLLKRYYNEACRSWLASNPGERITIYEIAELLGIAYPLAFTQNNCCVSTFVYGYDEYLAANVTDRSESEQATSTSKETENPRPTTTSDQIIPSTSTSSTCSSVAPEKVSSLKNNVPASNFVSPEVLRPYPKTSTEQNITKKGKEGKESKSFDKHASYG
ncbi:hypothetical protein JTB14_026917 [Gonioctena quinquepunctata]|nr:hypothetical protein JTB14_026917 [Gonioctena quinquepunctata]